MAMPTGNGKIPSFTDSERLKTAKMDCAKSLQRQRILSAWTSGLLTFKIQRSVDLKAAYMRIICTSISFYMVNLAVNFS